MFRVRPGEEPPAEGDYWFDQEHSRSYFTFRCGCQSAVVCVLCGRSRDDPRAV